MVAFLLGVLVGTVVFVIIPEILWRQDHGISIFRWKRKH